MRKRSNVIAAIVIVLGLAFAGNQAMAQQSILPGTSQGFDGYRAAAVTAGLLAGAVAATVVTDGLIIPVYAYATGGGFGGYGHAVLRGGLRLLGAVSGGFYAGSWYLSGQAPTVSLPK